MSIAIGILIILSVCLIVRDYSIHKSLKEIESQLKRILKTDTNQLIRISSSDKGVRRLANTLNDELKILRKEKINIIGGNSELKQSIINISHDLRTPLTAIISYLDIIDDEKDEEIKNEYMRRIRNRIDALKDLTAELFSFVLTNKEEKNDINNISDTSGSESASTLSNNSAGIYQAKFDDKSDKIKIIPVLQDCMLDFYQSFKERGIEPTISEGAEALDDKDIYVNMTQKTALRIFENIVSNALKYGKNVFEVDYYISEDGFIHFEFTNESDMLTNISLSKLFDKYYTVQEGRDSTGLGLLIARKMAEGAGGSVMAELDGERFKIKVILPVNEQTEV